MVCNNGPSPGESEGGVGPNFLLKEIRQLFVSPNNLGEFSMGSSAFRASHLPKLSIEIRLSSIFTLKSLTPFLQPASKWTLCGTENLF